MKGSGWLFICASVTKTTHPEKKKRNKKIPPGTSFLQYMYAPAGQSLIAVSDPMPYCVAQFQKNRGSIFISL